MGNKGLLPCGLSTYILKVLMTRQKQGIAYTMLIRLIKASEAVFLALSNQDLRIKTWIRHFPGQYPFPNFLIFIIYRIMQGLGANITPETV